MTHLTRQDADLHHEDGSHRSTPPSTAGRMLKNHERRLLAHLELHRKGGARWWRDGSLAQEDGDRYPV